jgi:hypothetical protein
MREEIADPMGESKMMPRHYLSEEFLIHMSDELRADSFLVSGAQAVEKLVWVRDRKVSDHQ